MEDKILGFQYEPVSAKPTYQVSEVKAFCLKGKTRLSWNTAAVDLQKRSFAGVFQNKCS